MNIRWTSDERRTPIWSLDALSGDVGWLPTSEQPAGREGGERRAGDDDGELGHGGVAQVGHVAEPGDQYGVGADRAEGDAEQRERAGAGGGDRPSRDAGSARRRERAQVAGRLAADQSDRHGEDAEREHHPDGGGTGAQGS